MTDPIKTAREALASLVEDARSAIDLEYVNHPALAHKRKRGFDSISKCEVAILAALDQVQNVGVDVKALREELIDNVYHKQEHDDYTLLTFMKVIRDVIPYLAASGHLQTPVQGWKLVPVKMTAEMKAAYTSVILGWGREPGNIMEAWDAVLEATPPATERTGVE
jgi:hypothetical protein